MRRARYPLVKLTPETRLEVAGVGSLTQRPFVTVQLARPRVVQRLVRRSASMRDKRYLPLAMRRLPEGLD